MTGSKHPQPTQTQSTSATVERVDQLIENHVLQHVDGIHSGHPYAAISASDRLSWANEAGVALEFIDERLDLMCDRVEEEETYWAVPRYQLKTSCKPADK
jgi:hypothetical protein